jgi:hypothetical protein
MVSWIINCEPFTLCGIEQFFVGANQHKRGYTRRRDALLRALGADNESRS